MAGTTAMLTVACVLYVHPTGRSDYDAGYVARLQRNVAKHLKDEHRFVCLSNVDVPCERIPLTGLPWSRGWWAKMEMFRPDLPIGRMLTIDLDTVPVGDLTDIAAQTETTLLTDFNVPEFAQSGLMMLPAMDRKAVWDAWIACPEAHIARQGGHGDGGFIRSILTKTARWQDVLPGQVVSYKNHVKPAGRVPAGARIVCFHGAPRPADLGDENFMKVIWNG